MHSNDDQIWELVDARGPAGDVSALRDLLGRGPLGLAAAIDVLHDASGRIQFLVEWRRPRGDETAISLECLAQHHVGADVILATLFHEGRVEVRVAGSDGDRLLRYYRTVESLLAGRFRVRMLRAGEMRPDWSPMPNVNRPPVAGEDRKLVAYALGAGYYDSPKRIGVRELGEALGWSKSVVARRLREVERRALETLLHGPASSGAEVPSPSIGLETPAPARDGFDGLPRAAGEV